MFNLLSLFAFFALIDQTISQSSSSSSTGPFASGTVTFETITQSFTPRSRASCTQDNQYFWMLGGEDGHEPLSDVWKMPLNNQTVQFVTDSGQNDPISSGGGVASLLDRSLVYFGSAAGLSINDVYASHTGVQWVRSRDSAPWASRSDFAYVTLPATNIIVIMGGRSASGAPPSAFNTSDVWMNQDGVGVTWYRQSVNPPFGAVEGAAAVALAEHSIILTGGLQTINPTNTQLSSTVYLSVDLGVTWSVQSTNQFPPVAYHSIAVDSTGVVFLFGGMQSLTQTNQIMSSIYVSTNRGRTFSSLPVTGTSTSMLAYSCACLITQSINQRVIYIFGGISSVIGNGTQQGLQKMIVNSPFAFSASSISGVDVSGGLATQQPTLPYPSSSTSLRSPSSSSSSRSNNQSISSASSASSASTGGQTSTNQTVSSISSSFNFTSLSSTGPEDVNGSSINQQSFYQSLCIIFITLCMIATL